MGYVMSERSCNDCSCWWELKGEEESEDGRSGTAVIRDTGSLQSRTVCCQLGLYKYSTTELLRWFCGE